MTCLRRCSGERSITECTVRSSTDQASLWKQMMTAVSGSLALYRFSRHLTRGREGTGQLGVARSGLQMPSRCRRSWDADCEGMRNNAGSRGGGGRVAEVVSVRRGSVKGRSCGKWQGGTDKVQVPVS